MFLNFVFNFIIFIIIESILFLDNDINVTNLDIPVNAVATALKDFFSKKLPPLFTEDLMDELEDLSGKLFCLLNLIKTLIKIIKLV